MAWNNQKQQEKEDISVWSTKRVQEWYNKYTSGVQMDDSPWYNNMIGVRRANIVFDYTPEELSEFAKSASDPVYFAKYCEIMHGTQGYKPVELRNYQKKLLTNYYSNRFNLVLSCRQAGKCFFNGKITVNKSDKNEDFIIEDLYYKYKNISFLSSFKNLLLKIYRKL